MSRALVALLIGAALFAAGCGEEEKPSSAAGPSGDGRLTKQEFVARADAICLETKDAQNMIQDRIGELVRGNAQRGFATFLREQRKEKRAGFARLQKLSPPVADQAAVDEWLGTVEDQLDAYATIEKALRKDDRTALLRAVRQGRRADGEQEILADLLGLVDCRNTA